MVKEGGNLHKNGSSEIRYVRRATKREHAHLQNTLCLGGQNGEKEWRDEAGKEDRGAGKEREVREIEGRRREEEAVSHGH